MILEHGPLELFGKNLFKKSVVKPHFMLSTPLENLACSIFLMEGVGSVLSAIDYTDAHLFDEECDCGFNDLAHFSRCFKRYYALSPSDYRWSHTNEHMAQL
jgi:hypothetical protein